MKESICTTCGYVGFPKSYIKGNLGTELLLWCFFIVPGMIYSVWRFTTRYHGCPICKNATMIPIETPMGQKLLKELYKQ
jgi:hypothetical protein